MQIPPNVSWALSLGSGLAMGGLAFYVWTRRSVPGVYVLLATLCSIAHLFVAGAIEERCTTLADRVFWQHVQIPGYAALPVCCLLLALSYTARPLRGWPVGALFAVPIAGVLLNWTNAYHHLYWSRVWIDGTGTMINMGRTYGAGFWICVAYSYLLSGISACLLVHFLVRARTQRMRTFLLLAALLVPCAASGLYVFEAFPIRYLDITPYALTLTGATMMWAIFRYRFQGIVPIAARSVVDSMADGVIVLDLDLQVADLNPAAEALLGWPKAKFIGLSAAIAFHDYVELSPYHQKNGQLSGDAAIPSSGGQRLCAASAADVMRGKHRIGRIITLRDVTAERQGSKDLREARQAAEAAALGKSRFLANMSHEIRTPMIGVVGTAELLLDSGLTGDQREWAETVHEAALCLLSVINDILDFSKIDAGKLNLEKVPFDLYQVMDQSIRLMHPVAVKKGIALKQYIQEEVPRVIVGDPTRLRQVMLNLVGNAIKFTHCGGVAVRIERLETQAGEARIAIIVEDTGVGIAPDRIEVLFQEFSQADSSVTRNFGGTGLGLAISRRLVEEMGGTIRIESKLGCGSKFIVEMSVHLGNVQDLDNSPQLFKVDGEPTEGCRVLLAEDNLVNQKIGQRILEKLGCQVDLAINGREAIESTKSAQYDVILMDLQMPGMDGLQSTREIRRMGVRTPVVALTASGRDEVREDCEAAGMNAFMTKPIRLDELTCILRRFHG